MHRRFVVYSFTIAILLIYLFAQIPATTNRTWRSNERIEQSRFRVSSSLTHHTPIAVDGDQNLTDTALAEGWQGNGSSQNPYVIDRLEIDRGGVPGHCISISNTRLNFTISNCHFTGASIDPGAGILLSNVSYAEIENNTCIGDRYGISLESGSDSNFILNNTCKANYQGIRLSNSLYNIIEGNICDGNRDGIFLFYSDWCQIGENWLTNNTWAGIRFEASDFCFILNNTCLFNDVAGIDYFYSAEGLIANNTCRNNTLWGIYEYNSYNSLVTNNTFAKNGYGIYIDSAPSDCIFSWNIIETNRVLNAENHGDSDWLEYNYWSDYAGTDGNNDGIGDTPHILPDASDPHPLMYKPNPPEWILSPEDITIKQQDELFHAYYQAFAPAPLFWWVSDSVHFEIDATGHLISKYFLEAHAYELKIVVSNIYGISISADFTIRVNENIPPNWILAPIDQTLEAHQAFDYQLAVNDLSGIAAWELNNTMQFAISKVFYDGGSTARLTNTSTLTPGTYPLNISVFDTYDNKLSSVFTIRVKPLTIDSMPPSWVIASLQEVIEYGEPLALQLGAWDQSGIDHYWINDTVNFSIDASGTVRNATQLTLGEYSLEVRAYDPSGNYASVSITIVVVPSSAPIQTSIDLLSALIGAGVVGVGGVLLVALFFALRRQSEK